MVKSVLTIDLDTFTNCHTYAKHMNFEIAPEDAWNIIYYLEKTGKYGINTDVDIRALSKAMDIIKEKCNNTIIKVIDEHHEIIPILEEYKCKDSVLYNIDAHFDINYGNDNKDLSCENWVLHARAKRLISTYTWVHVPMSDMNCLQYTPFKFTRCCIDDLDISTLPNFDMVVICKSFQFTPIKHHKALINILLNKESDK